MTTSQKVTDKVLTKGITPSKTNQELSVSCGPGTKDTNPCISCNKGNTQASVQCSNCDEALCEHYVRKHRCVQSLQKHDVIGPLSEVRVQEPQKVNCKEHIDEKVEFLCKDCKKVICHKCCTVYHRKCGSIVTIESEISFMKSTLTKDKETMVEKLNTILMDVEKRKLKLADVTQSWKQTELDIKSESQKLREVIDLQEKKLLEELESVADKEIGQLKSDIKTGEMRIQMYEQQSELKDQAMTSDCDMGIYKMCRSSETGPTELEDDRSIDLNMEILDGKILRKNTDKLIEAINDLQLGDIDVTYESGIDLTGTPVLQHTMNVRVPGDQKEDCPVDVVVLDVDGTKTIVVTNWNYNTDNVKSFYSRNSQLCHSTLSWGGSPWGLTQLRCNQVAVTVPHTRQIATIEVNPDLKLLSTIRTQKHYWGITSLTASTIAVGSGDTSHQSTWYMTGPPSVDILDIKGTVLRSISPSVDHKNLIKRPHFLCTTKTGNILVSDWGTNSVLCLTPQGDVLFNYSPTGETALASPQGITVTSTGDILVAGCSPNNVLHLTESGKFVGHVLTSLDGQSNTRGLALDTHGQLYFCIFTEGVIKVIKI